MITWRLVLIDLRAILVICSDCCSQSLATSFITSVLLCRIMNGVASIDSTMLARMGLSRCGGTRSEPWASVSSTKPNSPACARYRPTRSDTPVVAPSRRASKVVSASLNSTGSVVSTSTNGQRSSTMCQSSSMPTVMKNRPSSTSWKGRMSVSTWGLNSVSEISMPAMKAPSARLRPKRSVSQARPSVISSRFSTNSSSLRRRATMVSHQRIRRWPPVSSSVISTVAFSPALPSASSRSSVGALSAGISTKSGTTARSWNSSTPITRLPCSLSSSSRSAIIFTTMAVLLMASAPDSASAVRQDNCHSGGTQADSTEDSSMAPPVASAIVITTWDRPSPKTCMRIARNLGRLNSRPITNISSTTPNSPRCCTVSARCASASAFGPISTPTAR